MFAEVAVNRRVNNTFFYDIPAELSGKIALGHLVKVSFGTAYTTAIVIGIHREVTIAKTKPILERLDPLPVVTSAQIALARWLSEQTLTPFGMCLWLMLPPGLAKTGDTLYTLIDENAEANSPTQTRIVSLLRRRGSLRGRQLTHAMPQTRWQASISGLMDRGVVQSEPILDPPDVKPKMIRAAQLAIPSELVSDLAPRLGRESRRANVLEVLLAARDRRMAQNDICLAVECKVSSIQLLEKSGDVTIEPKQAWAEFSQPIDDIRTQIGSGRWTPDQEKAIKALLEAGGTLSGKGANTQTIKDLEADGTVIRRTAPAIVELRLTPEETLQRIIDLRGGQPYLDILNYLAENEGEAVDVKLIYAKTGTDLTKLQHLADDGLVLLSETETWRDPLTERNFVPTLAPPLTAEQEQAWTEIRQHMDTIHWGEISPRADTSGVFLLHGVTGSGKTEIYLRAVERALAQGRQAIVMVPEISLTPQTVRRFAARFPGRVSIVHSDLTPGERYDTWRRARLGEIHVIVGARSALFAPL
ncbi:MAG TPA: DEAD/DEAH box helicase, partial [Aggregatilineaceae bacterium]|nr:DEAD/DEAH box helicase [Aggregatilineaceae bacterium]